LKTCQTWPDIRRTLDVDGESSVIPKHVSIWLAIKLNKAGRWWKGHGEPSNSAVVESVGRLEVSSICSKKLEVSLEATWLSSI
jgi:hypothetical protein